jgi:GAF domain-containing protein
LNHMYTVSLVDADRQWFKSCIGAALDRQSSRDHAFCAYAILQPKEIFIVNDTLLDPRFALNPLVTGYPFIRFYAGCPLVNSDGIALGTICTIDTKPNTLTSSHLETLRVISRQAVAQLELRKRMKEMRTTMQQLEETKIELTIAKKAADDSAKAKAEFLANMSHGRCIIQMDMDIHRIVLLSLSSCVMLHNH